MELELLQEKEELLKNIEEINFKLFITYSEYEKILDDNYNNWLLQKVFDVNNKESKVHAYHSETEEYKNLEILYHVMENCYNANKIPLIDTTIDLKKATMMGLKIDNSLFNFGKCLEDNYYFVITNSPFKVDFLLKDTLDKFALSRLIAKENNVIEDVYNKFYDIANSNLSQEQLDDLYDRIMDDTSRILKS